MKWDEINTQTCSIARSMSIFGDRWTLMIIRQLFMRIRRFSLIQKSLGISKHRLSDRLNRLLEDEIIYKEIYDEARNRFEYKLTEKGLDLYPLFVSITKWGDKWESDEDGPPIEYVHKDCGHAANAKLCCSECGDEIHAKNTGIRPASGILKKIERGEFSEADVKFYSRALDGGKGE